MASLYRKWRPQSFSEVAGQEHVTKTLLNAVKSGRISHAYLFAGPRGTGKTSIARLLAKALNCDVRSKKLGAKGKDWNGEPCNECDSCREITGGQSLDVIEIDAASNRGIEEIRDLREKIKFAPGKSTYKVFIIDEVHMLTREAFNALLKTLEEPPAHAIFILATTEAHKVPATIVSRCQRYDFRRAKRKELRDRLEEVAKGEKIDIAPEALDLLANLAEGSYRDGLSLLDQVVSAGSGEKGLVKEDVQQLLGIGGEEAVKNFLRGLLAKDCGVAMGVIGQLSEDGVDFSYFTGRLIDAMRQLLLIRSGIDRQSIGYEMSEEEWEDWKRLGHDFSYEELLKILRELIEGAKEIKLAPLAQLPLEMLVWRWGIGNDIRADSGEKEGTKTADDTVTMQDIRKVEDTANSGSMAVDAVSATEDKSNGDVKPFDNNELWKTLIKKVKPHNHSLFALLNDSVPLTLDDEKMVVGVRFRFHAERLYDKKNRPIIEKILADVLERPCRLECQISDKLPKPQMVEEGELLESVVEVFGMEE